MLHKYRSGDSVFAHRDMRLVLPGRALSFLGDSITFIVLLLKVAEDGEPIRLTWLLAAYSLPLFAMTPVAGRIVDEYDSRAVLVVAGSVQVAASLAFALSHTLLGLVVAMLALQTGQSVTAPAWSALTPRIVGEHLIGRAVGIQQALAGMTGLAGAAVGGVLYDGLGYTATILIDTATFAALVVVAAAIRTRRGRRFDARAESTSAAARDQPRVDGGLAVIRSDAVLRVVIPSLCLVVLGIESINVVEVFLVRDDLGGSATDYGLVSAAWMLGQSTGPLVAGRITDDRRRVSATATSAVGIGALIAVIGLSPALWPVYPLYALAGVGVGVLNGCLSTLVVTRSADAQRGRVIAVMVGATRGCSVVGMICGGVLGELVGARTTLVVCGSLAGVVALLVLRARSAATAEVSPMPTQAATMEA
jgi:MFS family permease